MAQLDAGHEFQRYLDQEKRRAIGEAFESVRKHITDAFDQAEKVIGGRPFLSLTEINRVVNKAAQPWEEAVHEDLVR